MGSWYNQIPDPAQEIKSGMEYKYKGTIVTRKPVFEVCDQVGHKPACAAT